MKNTTERILDNGGRCEGCLAFGREINKNNPFSAEHWYACISNNPGGPAPVLNPNAWEEEWGYLISKTMEWDNPHT